MSIKSGMDPESFAAWVTIAGFHIEAGFHAGTTEFSDFSEHMLAEAEKIGYAKEKIEPLLPVLYDRAWSISKSELEAIGMRYEKPPKAVTRTIEPAFTPSKNESLVDLAVNIFPTVGTICTNSIGMELVYIPSGEFMMGSENAEEDEKPVHKVTISKGFWMGKYPVTQSQWESVMGTTVQQQREKTDKSSPLYGEGFDYPMHYVLWAEAQEFIHRLNERNDGYKYSLPTEAEWEYSARAGTTGDYAGNLDDMAWYDDIFGSTTHPVGQKLPNAFGLYDMHGNVWEWCRDWFDPNYYAKSPRSDPTGPNSGERHVLRGGAWYGFKNFARSANRYWDTERISSTSGFRVVARPR